VVLLSLGVWFWRRAPRRRPTSAPVIILIVRAECQVVLLSLFAPLHFPKRDRTRATPIALRHRARGSKFSRRPQRPCSVGGAKSVSHICDGICSAMRRRADGAVSGWRTATEKSVLRYVHKPRVGSKDFAEDLEGER